MRALDLFSGARTALAAFTDWDIDYVDILDGVDIRDFVPERKYDFIWASPPCESYSFAKLPRRHEYDRTLWLEALRVIDAVHPKYWVIENVLGACEAWGRPRDHCGPWYFWGWYPKVKFPSVKSIEGLLQTSIENEILPNQPIKNLHGWNNPKRGKTYLERSKIPYSISEAFYNALTPLSYES